MTALDKQIGGSHYKNLPIQPMDYIVKNKLGWREGNIVKLATRHQDKGKKKDIEKLIHYAQMLLEEYEEEENDDEWEAVLSPYPQVSTTTPKDVGPGSFVREYQDAESEKTALLAEQYRARKTSESLHPATCTLDSQST